MIFTEVLIVAFLFVTLFMSFSWAASVYLKDASIADVVWGLGYASLAVFLWSFEDKGVLQAVVSVPVVLWGLRLSAHIATRNVGKGEDWRYQQMRAKSPKSFWWISYFKVFLLQGLLMLIISMPLLVAASSEQIAVLSGPHILLGLAIWSVGFFFEVVADIQLRRFIASKKKKGAVLSSGLWRYTRHPNYFGEAMMWWGLALVVVALPWGWLAFISPITITYLINKVSGVDMLEKKYKGNKAYAKYKKTTNSFFPWFPKNSKKSATKSGSAKTASRSKK